MSGISPDAAMMQSSQVRQVAMRILYHNGATRAKELIDKINHRETQVTSRSNFYQVIQKPRNNGIIEVEKPNSRTAFYYLTDYGRELAEEMGISELPSPTERLPHDSEFKNESVLDDLLRVTATGELEIREDPIEKWQTPKNNKPNHQRLLLLLFIKRFAEYEAGKSEQKTVSKEEMKDILNTRRDDSVSWPRNRLKERGYLNKEEEKFELDPDRKEDAISWLKEDI